MISLVALTGNLVLFGVKLVIGLLSGSIAAVTDSVNNLLDSASSVIALVSFHFSGKRRDTKHPHGHGRIEYISGLVVALTIILTALVFGYLSAWKIVEPQPVDASWWMVVGLTATIVGKGGLAVFYFIENRRLKSPLLDASGKDSVSDMLATGVVLVALVAAPFTALPVDGIAGCIVSLFILVLGLKSFMASAQLLVGYRPERGLVYRVRKIVLQAPSFVKITRLQLHDYGPTAREAVVMVKLNPKAKPREIERDIAAVKTVLRREYAVKTVIYWAP
jgi:cation diffusion facilitator family transporter